MHMSRRQDVSCHSKYLTIQIRLTVPFIKKMKERKNKLRYRGPKSFVNMKMKAPTITTGTGYM